MIFIVCFLDSNFADTSGSKCVNPLRTPLSIRFVNNMYDWNTGAFWNKKLCMTCYSSNLYEFCYFSYDCSGPNCVNILNSHTTDSFKFMLIMLLLSRIRLCHILLTYSGLC